MTATIKNHPDTINATSIISIPPKYASFWRRALALVIDVILINFTYYYIDRVASNVYDYLNPAYHRVSGDGDGISIFFHFVFIVLYFCFFWFKNHGRTPGNSVLGISVIDENGDRLKLSSCLIRLHAVLLIVGAGILEFVIFTCGLDKLLNLLPVDVNLVIANVLALNIIIFLALLILYFTIGFFVSVFDKKHQSWHDRVAKTLVVITAVPATKLEKLVIYFILSIYIAVFTSSVLTVVLNIQ
ncbi:MAG: RDD family protein [candidate division WWE3 bacterium]|nr:RDD family protein [candidate division WWE3 bacterium]